MEQVYTQLTSGVHKPKKHKVALFLCGSSGTGKTSSRKIFLKDANINTTLVTLNADELWTMTHNKNVKQLLHDLFQKTINDGYSFIIDGTCREVDYTKSLMEEARRKGYGVKLGMVYSNLSTTLTRLANRKHQPLREEIGRMVYKQVSEIAEKYMDSEEIYLYNNDHTSTLIYSKTDQGITCIHPNANFYFDVSNYC